MTINIFILLPPILVVSLTSCARYVGTYQVSV